MYSLGFMLFLLFIFIVAAIFIKLDSCYYPACFFITKFILGRIIDFERVRNQVAFQLVIIFIIVFIVIFKNKGVVTIKDSFFYRIIPLLSIFVIYNIILGIIYGHNLFQIFIDSYKYLEIVVYYGLFRICWKSNYDIYRGLKLICFTMIIIGLIEIFITSRGGIGLNLIMSISYIAILLSINGYLKFYKVITVMSMLVVIMCETRTYIMCYMIGFTIMLFFLSKENRKKIVGFLILLLVMIIIVIVFGNINIFSDTISRFIDLSSGFSESGGYRINEYAYALKKFINNPIFGNGFGYLQYTYIEKMGWMNWGDFIHCIYIEILFKTGLVGIISIFTIVGNFILKITINMKYIKKHDEFTYIICCGGLCSFFTWALTYTFAPLSTYGSLFVGIIISSIALSNYYNEAKKGGISKYEI